MGYKYYNQETFEIELSKDAYIFLHCSAQKTRYGFRHVCDFIAPGDRFYTRAKCCYYNRTWERFRYESVLLEAARKLPPEWSAAVRATCDRIANDAREKSNAFLTSFKKDYEVCSDGIKRALSGLQIETEADARFAAAVTKAAALLTEK